MFRPRTRTLYHGAAGANHHPGTDWAEPRPFVPLCTSAHIWTRIFNKQTIRKKEVAFTYRCLSYQAPEDAILIISVWLEHASRSACKKNIDEVLMMTDYDGNEGCG